MNRDQKDALWAIWECVANLPDEKMEHLLWALRELAPLVDMDYQDFFDETGFTLYDEIEVEL